jgi:hypothetical protein
LKKGKLSGDKLSGDKLSGGKLSCGKLPLYLEFTTKLIAKSVFIIKMIVFYFKTT